MTEAVQKYVSLADVEQKYKQQREEVHRSIVMRLRSNDAGKFSHLTITAITQRAFDVYDTQWNQVVRRVSWNWPKEVIHWRRKKPSYWEMAIWHKQTLCGLVLGGPSRRRSRLYVEGIEALPEENPFKSQIIPIALLASEQYAVSIGCEEVWLVDPPDALLPSYIKAGYNVRLPNKFFARIFRKTRMAIKKVGR